MTQGSGESRVALGLMSGTSMDGVDAAVIESDGNVILRRGPSYSVPYPEIFRRRLADEIKETVHQDRLAVSDALIKDLTAFHIDAAASLLNRLRETAEWQKPSLIGFHGHTVLHRPERNETIQIGDAQRLADTLGLPTVGDLRHADVAAGGQGAPIAPVYHAAVAGALERPLAFVNIGGVSNITWIGTDDVTDIIAFDTGPGNALLDEWIQLHTGQPFDRNGEISLSGTVDQAVLDICLQHPYFDMPVPKSLDRSDFGAGPMAGLSLADGAATLTAFTVEAIQKGFAVCPLPPKRVLVTGGGRHNAAIMAKLAAVAGIPVEPVEAIGLDGDVLEAQAFAYLAIRSVDGLPLTFPGTTGVSEPLTGGRLYQPR